MGVWIETGIVKAAIKEKKKSHPIWVCGLKPCGKARWMAISVTPYMGVWIETGHRSSLLHRTKVTPYMGVWIETLPDKYFDLAVCGHTLYGCVD